MHKLLTFFNNSLHAIFNDQSFNHKLTNDIVSFEQLGPDLNHVHTKKQNINTTGYNKEELNQEKISTYPHILCVGFVEMLY